MRVFKTRHFAKWVKNETISDELLCRVVREIEQGLVDADLGGCVYKKRIPLPGRGKSSGARTILAFKEDGKVCFIFGYAKNEKANLTIDEKKAAKAFASEFFSYSDSDIDQLVRNHALIEVNYNG